MPKLLMALVGLGHTWLTLHNPHRDWSPHRIIGWNPFCHSACLRSALPPTTNTDAPPVEAPDLSMVHTEYHNLGEVLSKQKALSLPPHRPYDCSINLFPYTLLSTSCLYNLSRLEREAMERYIKESLAAEITRSSSSPLEVGFFFVEKKYKTLMLCIDFRELNGITIRNKYPLPLINSAFELLQGAWIFNKLDLQNAYHLVHIKDLDKWKTTSNTPLGHF